MSSVGRVLRTAADPWVGFFAVVLGAWTLLFVASAGIAGHDGAAALGPGMARMAPLLHALAMHASFHAPGLHDSLALTIGMWALMSVAMMAPTAVPMLRAYRHMVEGSAGRVPRAGFRALVGGYVAVWVLFSAIAGTAQHALAAAGWVSGAGVSTAPWLSAGLLAAAGAYQFSALKQACLSRCRSPMAFFLSHWREGPGGAFRMGLRHGLDCVGCCWALMALAFVGGTMNLAWMGGAMVLMIVEKLSAGRWLTAPLGVVLLGAGFVTALRALSLP